MKTIRRLYLLGTARFSALAITTAHAQTAPGKAMEGIVKLADSNIQYFSRGEGETIVLLPGGTLTVGYKRLGKLLESFEAHDQGNVLSASSRFTYSAICTNRRFGVNLRNGNNASRFMQAVRGIVGRRLTYANLIGEPRAV